jgi:hypothetical protein
MYTILKNKRDSKEVLQGYILVNQFKESKYLHMKYP